MYLNIRSSIPMGVSPLRGLQRNTRFFEPARDPRLVATQFLEELAKGSFKPGALDLGRCERQVLTLGHEWDNCFLGLLCIDVDNRVVQAAQSRMVRYQGRTFGQLNLSQLSFGSPTEASDLDSPVRITFEIWWDGIRDGTITVQRGDYRIWGPPGGWRVSELSP